jgi:hypothetical protein
LLSNCRSPQPIFCSIFDKVGHRFLAAYLPGGRMILSYSNTVGPIFSCQIVVPIFCSISTRSSFSRRKENISRSHRAISPVIHRSHNCVACNSADSSPPQMLPMCTLYLCRRCRAGRALRADTQSCGRVLARQRPLLLLCVSELSRLASLTL